MNVKKSFRESLSYMYKLREDPKYLNYMRMILEDYTKDKTFLKRYHKANYYYDPNDYGTGPSYFEFSPERWMSVQEVWLRPKSMLTPRNEKEKKYFYKNLTTSKYCQELNSTNRTPGNETMFTFVFKEKAGLVRFLKESGISVNNISYSIKFYSFPEKRYYYVIAVYMGHSTPDGVKSWQDAFRKMAENYTFHLGFRFIDYAFLPVSLHDRLLDQRTLKETSDIKKFFDQYVNVKAVNTDKVRRKCTARMSKVDEILEDVSTFSRIHYHISNKNRLTSDEVRSALWSFNHKVKAYNPYTKKSTKADWNLAAEALCYELYGKAKFELSRSKKVKEEVKDKVEFGVSYKKLEDKNIFQISLVEVENLIRTLKIKTKINAAKLRKVVLDNLDEVEKVQGYIRNKICVSYKLNLDLVNKLILKLKTMKSFIFSYTYLSNKYKMLYMLEIFKDEIKNSSSKKRLDLSYKRRCNSFYINST